MFFSFLSDFNILTHKSFQKMYSNKLKELRKLEIFKLLDIFRVNLKHNFIKKNSIYYFKKFTGQRFQLLLNVFKVLIH